MPFTQIGSENIVLNAADGTAVTGSNGHDWVADTSVAGHYGASAMITANDGFDYNSGQAISTGAHIDFEVNVTTGGTYYAWARGVGDGGSDRSEFALNGATEGRFVWFNTAGAYEWDESDSTVTLASGVQTLSFYERRDGTIVDRLILSTDPNFDPRVSGGDGAALSSGSTDTTGTYELEPRSGESVTTLLATLDAAAPADFIASGQVHVLNTFDGDVTVATNGVVSLAGDISRLVEYKVLGPTATAWVFGTVALSAGTPLADLSGDATVTHDDEGPAEVHSPEGTIVSGQLTRSASGIVSRVGTDPVSEVINALIDNATLRSATVRARGGDWIGSGAKIQNLDGTGWAFIIQSGTQVALVTFGADDEVISTLTTAAYSTTVADTPIRIEYDPVAETFRGLIAETEVLAPFTVSGAGDDVMEGGVLIDSTATYDQLSVIGGVGADLDSPVLPSAIPPQFMTPGTAKTFAAPNMTDARPISYALFVDGQPTPTGWSIDTATGAVTNDGTSATGVRNIEVSGSDGVNDPTIAAYTVFVGENVAVGDLTQDFEGLPVGDYTWPAEWTNLDGVQWESTGEGIRIKGSAVTPFSRMIYTDQQINDDTVSVQVKIKPHEQDHISWGLFQADGGGYYFRNAGNGRVDLFEISPAGVEGGLVQITLPSDLPDPILIDARYSNSTNVLTMTVQGFVAFNSQLDTYTPVHGGVFAVAEFNNTALLQGWAASGITATIIRALNDQVTQASLVNGDTVDISWTNANNAGPYNVIDEKGNSVEHAAVVVNGTTDRITLAIPNHWHGVCRIVDTISGEERSFTYDAPAGKSFHNLGATVTPSVLNPINAAPGDQLVYNNLSDDNNLVSVNDRGEFEIAGDFLQSVQVQINDGTTLGAEFPVVVYEGIESSFVAPQDVAATNGTAISIALDDFYNDTIDLDPTEQGSAGTLAVESSGLPAGLSRTGNTISGTLGAADGEYSPSVSVTDPSGTVQPLGLRLIVGPQGNVPPELANAIPNQGFQAGVTFSYVFPANTFRDRNGDALSYSYSNLPVDIQFSPSTRAIEGKHGIDQLTLGVIASDGELTATTNYRVTFTLGAPILAKNIPDMEWTIGQPIAGLDLDEYIEGLPDTWQIQGASLSGVTVIAGMLQGAPSVGLQPGNYDLTIRAENNAGSITSNTFSVLLREDYDYRRTQRHQNINGLTAEVPAYDYFMLDSADLDFSGDFSLYYQRNQYTSAGIEIDNQNPGVVSIVASAMDETSQKIRFLVQANSIGSAEVIVRGTTTSGPSYPVKYIIEVRGL